MTLRPRIAPGRLLSRAILPAILLVACLLAGLDLGRLSLWYDEVVTMRLARAEGPSSLIRLLGEIDATRAPLHPLLLQQWLKLFGTSELAARSFSALCGVLTVLLIDRIGRDSFDRSTGLWASWLAALSPMLVYYGREARMYAWLVLLTCVCWSLLLRPKSESRWITSIAYGVGLVALAYSHPLGLIMIATLALASGLFAGEVFGSRLRWFAVHAIAGLMVLPWLGRYLDHPPEHLSGRLPIKFLLGTPIGFIGGDFRSLAAFLALIVFGTIRHCRSRDTNTSNLERAEGDSTHLRTNPRMSILLLFIWLILPPLALYIYSYVAHPIFGPPRYTLFVAPAYLVLVASGLSRLTPILSYPAAIGMAGLSIASLQTMVFDPEIKGDWRECAAWIAREGASPRTVIVMSADPSHNAEVETARYYLPDQCTVIGSEEAENGELNDSSPVYLMVGARRGKPVRPIPDHLGRHRFELDRSFPGLAVFRGVRGP